MKYVAMALTTALAVTASGQPAAAGTRAHTETSFDLTVHAPYTETAKLFGPEGERVWAGKHWNPQFLYPDAPRDEQGAVFTIAHGPFTAVWIIAQHDLDARHFQYVYVIPDIMACTIDVRFTPADASTTKVHVTYARSSVSEAGDEHVAAMTEGDRKAGLEWQSAIDAYLAGQKDHPSHSE